MLRYLTNTKLFIKLKKLFFSGAAKKNIVIDFTFSSKESGKIVIRADEYKPLKATKAISLISKIDFSSLDENKQVLIDALLLCRASQFVIEGEEQLSADISNCLILNKTKEFEHISFDKAKNASLFSIFKFLIPVLLFFLSASTYLIFVVLSGGFNIGLLIIGIILFAHVLGVLIIFKHDDSIVEWGLFAILIGYFIMLFFLWLLFVDEIYLLNPTSGGALYVTIIYPLVPNFVALLFCFQSNDSAKKVKNKLKIIMIGAKKYPSRDGGIDAVVSTISEKLVDKGNDVVIFTRRKSDKSSDGLKVKTRKIFTINRKATDALIYSFFATLKGVFSNADVLHFHAEGNCYFLWLTRFSRKRIITTIHGLDWQREKFKGLGTKILLKSEKRIIKYSDDIITLSKKDFDYFKETYGVSTTIIPNGFETLPNIGVKIIKEKYGLEKDDYLLFLARIVPEKGLHYLIDAYKQTDIKRKLVVAGDAKHANAYYETIANQAQGDDRIIFTGFVSGDELNELFSNCYLYILPSDLEGMPISLLEALGHKRVCLVSDIPENHLDDVNSYYFKKSSVESLKEMLIKTNQKRKSFTENNNLASWDEVVDRTEELYKTKRKIK